MKEEIKDYLEKKLYSAKKGMVAIALCGAATLALTGCGNQEEFDNPIQMEQQVETNMYRLHTPEGYIDFNIENISEQSNTGLSNSNNYTRYTTTDGYVINFQTNGCSIENPNNEIIANYPNAYIEKLDFELELTPYNNGENASNPLDYNISQIELETSIDLES